MALAMVGLTVLVVVIFGTCVFAVRKVVDHPGSARTTRARFAQIDAAIDRVALPSGYTLVRSQRYGSLQAFDDQDPVEIRVYSVPPADAPGTANTLRASLRGAGFSGSRPSPSCFFTAHRGNVSIQVQFFPTATPPTDGGSHCPTRSWARVYAYTVLG